MARTIRKNKRTGKPERDDYHKRTHAARSCGHHGGCSWCEGNRLIRTNRELDKSKYEGI